MEKLQKLQKSEVSNRNLSKVMLSERLTNEDNN